ncbi:MAG: hypothetical protein AAF804_15495, partial [Bacteroidota bacterium]
EHNGEVHGVHRVPRTVPILLQADRNELTIRGGIFRNGLSSTRAPYPFWQPITLQLNAAPLDTVDLGLEFEYWPRDSIVVYPLEENFEGGGGVTFVSNLDLDNPTRLEGTTSRAYQGNWSGRVLFTETSYNFEALSADFLVLPRRNDNDVYLEITYQNTTPFTAGLFYTNLNATNVQELPLGVGFLSEDKWTTSYLHLQPLIQSVEPGLFKLYLRGSGENSEGEIQPGNLFIDQVRIIHFK